MAAGRQLGARRRRAVALGGFALGWHLAGGGREAAALLGLIALLAVAMGIQSAAVRRLDVPGIATTYMTGTLTSAVTGLVARRRAPAHPAVAPPCALSRRRWERGRETSAHFARRVWVPAAMIGWARPVARARGWPPSGL